jgi:hypothetical protein
MTDLLADAEDHYQGACARRRAIEEAWRDRGSPLLGRGSQGQEIEHPLVAMLRAHDLLVKLSVPLRQAHAGPQSSAVVRTRAITRKLEAVPTMPAKKTKIPG